MNTEQILKQLDEYFDRCEIDKAENYLIEQVELAKKEQDFSCMITLYNEIVGFYRDAGKFDKSIEYAETVIALMQKLKLTGSTEYATTLLNAANAYRAANKCDTAFRYYDKVAEIYNEKLNPEDMLFAGLYNNISLLYQQTEQWDKSCEYLKKALNIVEKENDMQKTAISYTNLAVSLLKLNRVDEAEKYLADAAEIFEGQVPSDFHYSAAVAALGDAAFARGKYISAAEYYEKALSEIELHMGRNNFYDIVSENLELAYNKCGGKRKTGGLELCRLFYESFGKPMIHHEFSEYENCIAVGLIGEGSECFGYDDEYSADHDFGPGFCMWLSDELYDKIGEKLRNAYNLLPKTYMGVTRISAAHAEGRVGVCRISELFMRFINIPHAPRNDAEWLSSDDSALAALSNGEIFADGDGLLSRELDIIKKGYPETVRLRKIANETALMAQSGQYNYARMMKRGDSVTAHIYAAEFIKSTMRALHLLCGKYAPYEKWLYRSTGELNGFSEICGLINNIVNAPVQTDAWNMKEYPEINTADIVVSNAEKICEIIISELKKQNLSEEKSTYLGHHADYMVKRAEEKERKELLVDAVIQLEWNAFDKVQNEGGRAECQDNWTTFSIMRKSQYLTWPNELLESFINDFQTANKEGRNLITEKYGRMMESTAPEKYREIESQLPPVSEEKKAIREAIIGIQVEWMENFSKQYPKLSHQARIIHTSGDSEYDTSYETYLRGELTTYSETTLYIYGRWIAELSQKGKNLAEMIIRNTCELYGYSSLDEAERLTLV